MFSCDFNVTQETLEDPPDVDSSGHHVSASLLPGSAKATAR
jgi:hypothetical protein